MNCFYSTRGLAPSGEWQNSSNAASREPAARTSEARFSMRLILNGCAGQVSWVLRGFLRYQGECPKERSFLVVAKLCVLRRVR